LGLYPVVISHPGREGSFCMRLTAIPKGVVLPSPSLAGDTHPQRLEERQAKQLAATPAAGNGALSDTAQGRRQEVSGVERLDRPRRPS
jgi:hypothetical protein